MLAVYLVIIISTVCGLLISHYSCILVQQHHRRTTNTEQKLWASLTERSTQTVFLETMYRHIPTSDFCLIVSKLSEQPHHLRTALQLISVFLSLLYFCASYSQASDLSDYLGHQITDTSYCADWDIKSNTRPELTPFFGIVANLP